MAAGVAALRCERGKLLAKIYQPPDTGPGIIEFACDHCARHKRRHGEPDVRLVLHRFSLDGRLLETITV